MNASDFTDRNLRQREIVPPERLLTCPIDRPLRIRPIRASSFAGGILPPRGCPQNRPVHTENAIRAHRELR
jgi:hypothetical protein